MPWLRRLRRAAFWTLPLYAAGAVLLGHEAWASPTTRWIGGCCDPEQTMWYLRWAPYAIAHLTDPFVSHQLNAPGGVNLMWQTPTLLVGVVAAPVTLLLGPIVAYNVVVTAAIALSCWCSFLVLRRYARGTIGPLIGGAVYGFSPYVIPQSVLHLDLAIALFPPLLLLIVDELLVRRRRSPRALGIALGLLVFAQLLTEEELIAVSAILGVVLLAVLAAHRPERARALVRPVTQAVGIGAFTFGVLAAWPLAVQFAGPQRVKGPLQNADVFSTDLLNTVLPTKFQLIAPGSATDLSQHFSGLDLEANAYLGLLLLVFLAAFAGRHWRDLRVRAAAIVGAVALVLSLGPHLVVNGQSTGWPLPMWVVGHLPLLDNIQPNRIVVFSWLAVAVLVTIAVDDALALRSWRRTAPRLAAVVAALVPLLPAPLPSSSVAVPVFFQRWASQGIADSSTVLVAPYFRDGAGADPALWSAVAGDGLRMPEAYAFVPLSDGTALYGSPPTQLSSIMESIQDRGTTIVARGGVRLQVAHDLAAAGVRDVIVGPMNDRSQMVAFFTDLFGRAPAEVDGVDLWRDVDSSGVSPPPV